MEFEASLTDFIVYHEQFVGKDGQKLRLLSAEVIEAEGEENQKLVDLSFRHTSAENPLFALAPYNGVESEAKIQVNKLVIMLQLEALLSIFKFQDTVMKKLPQEPVVEQPKKEEQPEPTKEQKEEENKKIVKKTSKFNIRMTIFKLKTIFNFRCTFAENQCCSRRISNCSRFTTNTNIRHTNSRCQGRCFTSTR